MEIKGSGKQLLIFLQTLGEKYISDRHTQRVYVITEKVMHNPAAPKLGFPDIFLLNQGYALYTSARYTRMMNGWMLFNDTSARVIHGRLW